MRSSVSMVMRLPSRNLCTSLPSLTARRPNVVSAISAWRQNSEIWLRIWSFFIGPGARMGGQWLVGRVKARPRFTTPCPPLEPGFGGWVEQREVKEWSADLPGGAARLGESAFRRQPGAHARRRIGSDAGGDVGELALN